METLRELLWRKRNAFHKFFWGAWCSYYQWRRTILMKRLQRTGRRETTAEISRIDVFQGKVAKIFGVY